MERSWVALPLVILLVCSTGCMNAPAGEPPLPPETSVPATTLVTATPTPVPEPPAAMSLQPSDLSSEYTLEDRSAMALEDVPPLAIQLGWLQGYYVAFSRKNPYTNDVTFIRQTINVYNSDDMGGVFLLEKDELKNQQLTPGSRHEIPFPAVGERSIAFRETDPLNTERPVTYTVLFIKKDVLEKITMAGTNTDYETIRQLSQRADSLIR